MNNGREPEHAKTMKEMVDAIRCGDTPISQRMRMLFHLRSLETPEAAQHIQRCMSGNSVLVDHEVAYVLGQLRQPNSIEFLLRTAGDGEIDPIVRHEAIEALGNFGDLSLIDRLKPFLDDPHPILKESAVLAISKLAEGMGSESRAGLYGSHDPAYPCEGTFQEAARLFEGPDIVGKYRAIFYFRDLNSKDAVDVLARGFKDSSDLLRHEIAYVFGQMQNEHSVRALVEVLDNSDEKDIVRHEAAEALGNIGSPDALDALRRYTNSDIRILRESAHVGLGIANNNCG